MPDKHLETENKDYYPEKPILWIIVELTPLIRLKNVALRTSFWNVYPANAQGSQLWVLAEKDLLKTFRNEVRKMTFVARSQSYKTNISRYSNVYATTSELQELQPCSNVALTLDSNLNSQYIINVVLTTLMDCWTREIHDAFWMSVLRRQSRKFF